MSTKHAPARTAEEIIDSMIKYVPSNIPFNINGLMKEAMEIYAKQRNAELLRALTSLKLSVMAHPDYTGKENEEWTDLIELADEAIKKATE